MFEKREIVSQLLLDEGGQEKMMGFFIVTMCIFAPVGLVLALEQDNSSGASMIFFIITILELMAVSSWLEKRKDKK